MKAKLTLEKAVKISQGMEAAAQQLKELNKRSHRSSPVLTVQTPGKPPCGHCGHGNHSKDECKFRNATCCKCGKVGHIAPVYTSGKSPKAPTRRAKWLTTGDSADSDSASDRPPDQDTDEEPQSLSSLTSPLLPTMEVNGRPLGIEVDTGAAVSLTPESAIAALVDTTQLQPSIISLKTYTGSGKGLISVDVLCGQQHHRELKLLIV